MFSDFGRGRGPLRGRRRRLVAAGLLLALCSGAAPWGKPHTPIAGAALERLPADHPLRERLGDRASLLRGYVWMADWAMQCRKDSGGDYFVDDFLRFPEVTRFISHMPPDVGTAYAPFFRRAVQALRTEDALNAARWTGSLLHYVTDNGSPAHAASVGGDDHLPMENWVDLEKIRIPGYAPALLGKDVEKAIQGVEKRMAALMEYSRVRGEKLLPLIRAGDREGAEPMILECALETARATADVLHTLGVVAAGLEGGASLEGFDPGPPADGVPAKVSLLGTPYATLADPAGRYVFRNLPPGRTTGWVIRAGSENAFFEISLPEGGAVRRDVDLVPSSFQGNLLRNEDLSQRWIRSDTPDGWFPREDAPFRSKHAKGMWKGEPIPVEPGARLRLLAEWRPDAEGEVFVEWHEKVDRFEAPGEESLPLRAGEKERNVVVPAGAFFARVNIRGKTPPAKVGLVRLKG